MKLPSPAETNESFSMGRMKNERSRIFFSCLVLFTVTFVTANEDQSAKTELVDGQKRDSSFGLHEKELPSDILQSLDTSTEERSQSTKNKLPPNEDELSKTVPVPGNVGNEATNLSSVTEDGLEDIKQNVTDESSKLPKRDVISSLMAEDPEEAQASYAQPASSLLTLKQLQSCSCEAEASKFGHEHAAGTMMHEIFCETNKLLHYILIAGQNLKSELELELLFDLEEKGKSVISLTDLFGETLFEIIENGLTRIEIFIENPENLKILVDIIENSIPISEMQETFSRLKVAIKNFFVRIQELNINASVEILKKVEEEVLAAIENALNLFYGYLSNRFEEKAKLLSKTTSLVELLFDKLFAREPFYRYIVYLKEFIDSLVDSYHGYNASGLAESIIGAAQAFVSGFVAILFPNVSKIPAISWVARYSEGFDRNGAFPSSSFSRSWDTGSIDPETESTMPEPDAFDRSEMFSSGSPESVQLFPETSWTSGTSADPIESEFSNSNGGPGTLQSQSFSSSTSSSTEPIIDVVPPSTSHGNTPFSPLYPSFPLFPSFPTSETSFPDYAPRSESSSTETTPFPSSTSDDIPYFLSISPSKITSQTDSSSYFPRSDSHYSSSDGPILYDASSRNDIAPYHATNVQQDLNVPLLPPHPFFLSARTPQSGPSAYAPLISFSSIPKTTDSLGNLAIPSQEDLPLVGKKCDDERSNSFLPLFPRGSRCWNLQPDHQPLSEAYLNFLGDVERSIYKSLYSYLGYGNPALVSASNGNSEISNPDGPDVPAHPISSLIDSNRCGTSTLLSSLSNLNNVFNDIAQSRTPLQLPRNELASAFGNVSLLSPGDVLVIFARDGVALIGRVTDAVAPITFNAYKLKPIVTGTREGVKLWHLRSEDFRDPACEHQLKLLSQGY